MIGDLIDKQGVRNSKGYPPFCMLCGVSHGWMWQKCVFSFLPGFLFSHRYVGICRIRPGTVFSSTIYV